MFIDTHLHLIYPEKLSYPWLDGFEALNKPSRFDDYTRRAKRLGISGCLHMEVDVAPDLIKAESELIEGLAGGADSLMLGAISSCRPEAPDFPEFLDWAREKSVILGFRRVLHVVPDEVSQNSLFRDNIKRLSGTGLTFDLCALPHQLPLMADLVDHCPDVQFILDHCGVPAIAQGEMSPWREHLSDIAQRPNVVGKISGVIAYADAENWSLDHIRPWVDHTVSAFGPERIIWGSDNPVCDLGGGLETWVAVTHALTHDWSHSERDALYQGNAKRLWRI
ncbi:amidohydrolase [uncultured Roseobacter sp.]|uniref:amidohydrolase family protein n=1 Tax=uncultured Roseobacter sp. TaxID=114847 RepID=UPI00260F9304|nr:amidohydrolase [uncultured Roseobacter sp.]